MNNRKQNVFLNANEIKQRNYINKNLDEMVDKTVNLSDELKLEETLSFCNLYSYLLYNGYFSYDKNFTKQNFGELPASSICLGTGDEYAISDMLELFLTKKEIQNYSFLANYSPSKITINPIFDVNKKEVNMPGKGNYRLEPLNLIIPSKTEHFIYDPSLMAVLRVLNNREITLVNGEGKMYLNYPDSNIFGDMKQDNGKSNKLFYKTSKIPSCKRKLCIQLFEDDLIKFKDANSLIENFYTDIHPNIENVCKVLKRSEEIE